MCEIRFDGGSDFLLLRILGRTKPESQDYWDANWLHCVAEASVGRARVDADWQLRNEDLAGFLDRLEALDGKQGVALLDTLDDWIDVCINQSALGDSEARCELEGVGQTAEETIEFTLHLGRNAVPALIAQVRAVLDQYPFVGHSQ